MNAMLAAAAALAVTWYPAPDWKEGPDPDASPHARKGGIVRFNGSSAPKSHNAYVDNSTYTRMMFALMYEKLISSDPRTLEFEPCLARRWSVSDDGREFTFVLDERAKWSDGRPVSAEDVKWTFDSVVDPKNDTGPWKVILGGYEEPEILDAGSPRPLQIRFRKRGDTSRNWRDIINCGTFYVMPKHAFEGKDFNKLDLKDAVVGGPYRITRIAEQVETEYGRVEEWWRRDAPSCKNTCNFDRILLRYYTSNENAFDAFKKRVIDVYPVFSARIWARETGGAKFAKNWIVKRRVYNHEPIGFQGFGMNMRRWPFDDLRVRKAMAKLLDREMMNRTMMYNEYFLQNSIFCDLYDEKHPCGNELLLIDREGAAKLLAEAGFARNPQTGVLEKDGRPFTFTFLSRGATEDKFLVHFNAELQALGIKMSIVRKDFANWQRDLDEFDFDMTWNSWSAGTFRNPELMWLSSEADRKTSNNTTGFKSAEVDRLIAEEKLMGTFAEREEAYRKIDALVTAQCPYAFLWNIKAKRILNWNKFGTPDGVFGMRGDEEDVFTYWWYDEDKAKELEKAMSDGTFLPSVPLVVDYDKVAAAREGGSAK